MINSFKSFLVEEQKTVYFTFGRMNPPTVGHGMLMDKLAKKAGKNPYRIFLSQSADPKKNPLPFKNKVKFVRKMFPKHARSVTLDPKIKNIFDSMVSLYKEGYANVVLVVGQDRVREFDITLNKYNGVKARHGFYAFNTIKIISAGQRDPDADDATGASATKQRIAASDNDFTAFSQGLPKSVTNPLAKALFNAVRSGMGLKESTDFRRFIQLEPVSDIRESYVEGKLYAPEDTVVIKESGELGTVTRLGTNYVIVQTHEGKVIRKWLDDVEKLEE